MQGLKLNIKSLKEKATVLEKDQNNLQATIENDIGKIRKYQQTINKILLDSNLNRNYLKLSLTNEELIKTYYVLMQTLLDNKEKLIQIKDSRERKALTKSKENNIKNDITALQSSIDLISKEIININKTIHNDFSFEKTNYVTNPSKEIIENFNELCVQQELITKFNQKSIQTHSLISERTKMYSSLNNELKSLKQEKGIKEVQLIDNESTTILPDVESIGSLDNEIENNIDSPRFLRKVKKKSKIDFAFHKKLELNAGRLKEETIQPKNKANIMLIKKIDKVIPLVKPKKLEENKKSDKECVNNNNISIDEELERTKVSIKELTHKLGELLYKNRVFIIKQKEVARKMEDIDKKILRLEKSIKEERSVYEFNNNDNSFKATNEIDVLTNVNLYPLPA